VSNAETFTGLIEAICRIHSELAADKQGAKATMQNFLTVRHKDKRIVQRAGWVEPRETRRQPSALPDFMAFDPAGQLCHTGRDCRYPDHMDVRPERYAVHGNRVPAIPAGTTARRRGGWL
jgi:hypothetical protein